MRWVMLWMVLVLTASAQEYTDLAGRTVAIEKSERIACIGPGALRLATYMGLQSRLVGVERIERRLSTLAPYSMFLGAEQIGRLPVIGEGGPGKMPNLEALVRVRPDVIFAAFVDAKQVAQIEAKTKIPVVVLSYGGGYGGPAAQKKLAAVEASLRLMGEIAHHQKRAETLCDFMARQQARLAALQLPKRSVYIGGIGFKGAQGLGGTERDYPPFMLLGLENAVLKSDTPGHVVVQQEAILKADPDALFLDLGGRRIISERLADPDSPYRALRAYREGRIHWLLPYNFYNTNIENLFVDAWTIAEKLGATVNAEKEAEAVYAAFYGAGGAALHKRLMPLPEAP